MILLEIILLSIKKLNQSRFNFNFESIPKSIENYITYDNSFQLCEELTEEEIVDLF